MLSVRFHPEAREEALAAAEWYESRQPGLGLDFLAELERACAVLSETPLAWPLWGRVAKRLGIRKFLLSRFPYGIAYEAMGDEVVVYAIASREEAWILETAAQVVALP